MGPFFDSRKFLRTPSFAQDGLYDDELPPELPPEQVTPPPVQMSWNLPPPPRQRISLPPPPAEPKSSVMRQVLGTVAGMYVPQLGEEIKRPGYQRQLREYGAARQRAMDEAKLNETMAREETQTAAARAAMARGERENAQRDRTIGQAGLDQFRNVAPNAAVIDVTTGKTIGTNHLPAKPLPPGVKIGRDGKPFFEEGEKFVTLPAGVAPSVINATPRPDRGISALVEIVRREFPGASDEEIDAKVVERWKEQQQIASDLKKAQTDRAKRVTPARGYGGTSATEARRILDDQAKAAIAEAGSLDAAIAAATDEKVKLHLKAMKGGQIIRPAGGAKKSGGFNLRSAAGATAPTSTRTAPPTEKAKDPLGIR